MCPQGAGLAHVGVFWNCQCPLQVVLQAWMATPGGLCSPWLRVDNLEAGWEGFRPYTQRAGRSACGDCAPTGRPLHVLSSWCPPCGGQWWEASGAQVGWDRAWTQLALQDLGGEMAQSRAREWRAPRTDLKSGTLDRHLDLVLSLSAGWHLPSGSRQGVMVPVRGHRESSRACLCAP